MVQGSVRLDGGSEMLDQLSTIYSDWVISRLREIQDYEITQLTSANIPTFIEEIFSKKSQLTPELYYGLSDLLLKIVDYFRNRKFLNHEEFLLAALNIVAFSPDKFEDEVIETLLTKVRNIASRYQPDSKGGRHYNFVISYTENLIKDRQGLRRIPAEVKVLENFLYWINLKDQGMDFTDIDYLDSILNKFGTTPLIEQSELALENNLLSYINDYINENDLSINYQSDLLLKLNRILVKLLMLFWGSYLYGGTFFEKIKKALEILGDESDKDAIEYLNSKIRSKGERVILEPRTISES